ncbi:hypothetical protein M8C21_010460 [Ambrosia artemisiifolia]|uniref:Glycosyltransferase n=1 Tax=Ambrosia artemisiifolia TaxID=4212 RepID=A0AAD5CTW9_AMBAR|nr:hypothetical protein M8C21_010460 [Ambrosia artemisiifolia]
MPTIVLYPAPAMGHLISMVELGKFILKHHPNYSITVLTLTNSFNTGSTVSYVRHISATVPAISFHHLPDIALDLEAYPTSEAIIFDLIGRSVHNVDAALRSISPTALIIDLFCTSAMMAAASVNIPVYYFITSGACCLVEILYFPVLDRDYLGSFRDMNRLVYSPGMPPIPSSDMPAVPIKAITDGLCVEGHTPPLYCVGPVLSDGGDGSHECLKWLDSQPSESVVYLCFGSEGLFSCDQLKEIAKGLEMSGQRFLWVIRSPPTVKKGELFTPPELPDLDSLLPDRFLERTKDRGLVVKGWAPQVKVLSHDSVGGFVTHCGWNSVLESVRAGVPMVAWPQYAEQRMNKIVMVEEMKVALPMDESERGKVAAAEVGRRVRQLMESEEGKFVREVVKARKEDAARAINHTNGSSRVALGKLVESWTR